MSGDNIVDMRRALPVNSGAAACEITDMSIEVTALVRCRCDARSVPFLVSYSKPAACRLCGQPFEMTRFLVGDEATLHAKRERCFSVVSPVPRDGVGGIIAPGRDN